MREIIGDPLTGQLPQTQILLPDVLGPVRSIPSRRAVRIDQWPIVADQEVVNYERLRPGAVVAVRTRFGVRVWLVRTFGRALGGRRYLVGMDRNGWCHTAFLTNVISVDTLRQHLAAVKAIDRRSRVIDIVS